jgi:hypothetical protein
MEKDYTAMSYLVKTLTEYTEILLENPERDEVDKEIAKMFASLIEFIGEHLYQVESEQMIEANRFGILGKEARIVKDEEGKIIRLDYVKPDFNETAKAN